MIPVPEHAQGFPTVPGERLTCRETSCLAEQARPPLFVVNLIGMDDSDGVADTQTLVVYDRWSPAAA